METGQHQQLLNLPQFGKSLRFFSYNWTLPHFSKQKTSDRTGPYTYPTYKKGELTYLVKGATNLRTCCAPRHVAIGRTCDRGYLAAIP